MPGYKSSWTGTLANSDILDYLQKQAIMRFSTTAERDTDLTGQLREGMFVYIDAAPTGLYLYTGSEWRPYLTEWNTYTPAWSNLTLGSATQVARYRYIGGDMRIRGYTTLAADSSGTGSAITQTIPNSETSDTVGASGSGAFNDSGTGIYPLVVDIAAGATTLNFFHAGSSGAGVLTSASPATIANGDIIRWDITIPLTY
jgi:hypothetical protein